MAEDARDAEQRRRRGEGDRVRAVRERVGVNQLEFAQQLTEAARRLAMGWLRYDNTIVSKLELGTRNLSIDDTVVVASIDPDARGRMWLAWGDPPVPIVPAHQILPDPRAGTKRRAANDRGPIGASLRTSSRAAAAGARDDGTRRPRAVR